MSSPPPTPCSPTAATACSLTSSIASRMPPARWCGARHRGACARSARSAADRRRRGAALSRARRPVRVADDHATGEPAPLPPAEVAPRVISAQNAYVMDDMMADVIKRGTGGAGTLARARRHRRQDRHHQQGQGHLVQWLYAEPGRDRVGRFRPGASARGGRGRRAHRAADLDQLHARGAEGRDRGAPRRCRMGS